MSADVVLVQVGSPHSTLVQVTVTVTGGLSPPFDYVFFWTDADDEIPLVVTSSETTLTVQHIYPPPGGTFDVVVGVIPHGDDPNEARDGEGYPDFFTEIEADQPYFIIRQHPRDDAPGGSPRQGNESRSMQATARQGVNATYL